MKRNILILSLVIIPAFLSASFSPSDVPNAPYLKIKGSVMTHGVYEGKKNLQVKITVKQTASAGEGQVEVTANVAATDKVAHNWYSTHVTVKDFGENFEMDNLLDIHVEVIDPETGNTLEENDYFVGPDDFGDNDQWDYCERITLGVIIADVPPATVADSTVKGTVTERQTQKPVKSFPLDLSPLVEGLTDENGNFRLLAPEWFYGDWTFLYAGLGGSVQSYPSDSFVITHLNIQMPDQEGVDVGPMPIFSRQDWEWMRTTAEDTLGIILDTDKSVIFGSVKNLSGEPIPEAVISLDPSSGDVIYFDAPGWKWDSRTSTNVLDGCHMSAGYAILNVTHEPGGTLRTVTATHQETGDIIGKCELMETPISGDGFCINLANIVADDVTPPDAINDLEIEIDGGATLTWTASGDDGSTGDAYLYEIRHSLEPVGSDTFNWWYCISDEVNNPPDPGFPGSQESFVIPGVEGGYFLVRTVDECMNRSEFSNVAGIKESHPSGTSIQLKVLPGKKGDIQIQYNLTSTGHATIKIYDASGALAETLSDGILASGEHTVTWNSQPGIYFVRLECGETVLSRKVVVLD